VLAHLRPEVDVVSPKGRKHRVRDLDLQDAGLDVVRAALRGLDSEPSLFVAREEVLLRELEEEVEDLVEVHLEQVGLVQAQQSEDALHQALRALDDEDVPEAGQQVGIVRILVRLREDGDQPGGRVILAVDVLQFQVVRELGQDEAQTTVELVEDGFQLLEVAPKDVGEELVDHKLEDPVSGLHFAED